MHTIDVDFISWTATIAAAWLIGDLCRKWTGLPSISIYGLIGSLLSLLMPGSFVTTSDVGLLLADIAFGLMLFEFGYRINLRWLVANPWIGVTGIIESAMTFGVTYALAVYFGISTILACLMGALTMATSPAGVIRVINEQHSSGQVTERILHLSAINCVAALFLFKSMLGLWVFQNSGSLFKAIYTSLIVMAASCSLGFLCGLLLSKLLKYMRTDDTVVFALAVIVLVSVAHTLDISPVMASLSLGLTARHYRTAFNPTQRNFGALGDILTVMLFVFSASLVEPQYVVNGAVLGTALLIARLLVKTTVVASFSHVSGISLKKGVLTGMALAPISVFAILLLEQSKTLHSGLSRELSAFAFMMLVLDILAPVVTQYALIWAKESKVR